MIRTFYPALLIILLTTGIAIADDAAALYKMHCASCHGDSRLGGMGPALLPENLGRLKKKAAVEVVLQGRAASQMPGFSQQLDRQQAESLVEMIYTPLPSVPMWDLEQISNTHRILADTPDLDRPVFDADPLNLFIVVELGDHHATVLNGDTMEPVHRFKTHFALHGGPKYSSDGRYVYFASRDGWISKFDIWNLTTVAEIRAGINTRNLAVSADDRYVMVANYLPNTLVLLDAKDLSLIRIIDIVGDGNATSRASAVYTAEPRQSFVIALKDIPEIWEIQYRDDPLPVYNGLMHDYRLNEGLAQETGLFPVRRIALEDHLDDFFFSQDYSLLFGTSRDTKGGQVVQMDLGRKIADIELDGMPHLGSGITWKYQGKPILATPNLGTGQVSIIDLESYQVIKQIPTLGPGFFMRSHENSPYAWVDVFFGPNRDAVHVIDKQTLEVVETLRPEPGKTAAHIEFDRQGKHALLSVWDMEGALVVYDAKTLVEVKRLPMVKPSGKYNVYNKITRSAGTSH
ncbi:MAG: cytochrome D1 domain-containing protein [bacterium]